MEPVTVFSIITVTGIILLLGLFSACLGYAYLTIRTESAQAESENRSADESGAGDTGDFVFGGDHETTESADPRQQL